MKKQPYTISHPVKILENVFVSSFHYITNECFLESLGFSTLINLSSKEIDMRSRLIGFDYLSFQLQEYSKAVIPRINLENQADPNYVGFCL